MNWLGAAAAMALAGAAGPGQAGPPTWVAAWTASPMPPEPPDPAMVAALKDTTVREMVRISAVGGVRVRVRLSNAFGSAPLRIDDAHVALANRAGSAAIRAPSDHRLTFGGAPEVTIPAGAEYLSDPVELAVPPLSVLSISLHLPEAPAGASVHLMSKTTSYLAPGDRTAVPDLAGATPVEHWYQLSGVEVQPARPAGAVVALGDSITDGHASTTNGNDRWPDVLSERLRAAGAPLAVVNAGISGNRVAKDGSGPNALSRLDRDVLAQAGARAVFVLEGVNDLGRLSREGPVTPEKRAEVVRNVIAAYGQITARAHARGLKVIGATILPFTGTGFYRSDADADADRRELNAWIRQPGHFDAVVDFDAVARDPAHPERLRPDYDSGDHLHPSPAGYRAMAEAVPIELLERLAGR